MPSSVVAESARIRGEPQRYLADAGASLIVPLVHVRRSAGPITWVARRRARCPSAHDLGPGGPWTSRRRCALAIDNARLYREARDAVSIRDEFLSVAAHELKTPMTSLRGYAQLLGREFDRGEVTNPTRAARGLTIQVQSDKLGAPGRAAARHLAHSVGQAGRRAQVDRPERSWCRDVIEPRALS